jgi:hypothetical protein
VNPEYLEIMRDACDRLIEPMHLPVPFLKDGKVIYQPQREVVAS